MKISLDPLNSSFDTVNYITRIIIDPIRPVEVCRVKDPNQINANNLYFLAKVISRQHALLYEVNNQIYVKDTKSTGGTWVNGKRLSKPGMESAPMKLNEDDILQFGEDTEFDGRIIQAVKLKVHLHQDQLYISQDNLSPEVKIKLVKPLPNVDLASPIESPTVHFIERNKSWIDTTTSVKKNLLDPTTIVQSDIYEESNLPTLPTLPHHIQEELNLLWRPLEKISIPFRDAEILLKKS